MAKEKYNAVARTKDTNKINVNLLLKKLVQKSFPSTRRNIQALILDSEKLLTKKTLVSAGLSPKNIHIPNPYSFKKIKREHKNTFNMSVGEYINASIRGTPRKFSFVFLDYMCSLDGNDKTSPIIDIKRFFEKSLPEEGCILGVTLSWRGKKKGGCYNELNRLDAVITEEAANNGYVAIKYPEGFSYNGMYFVVYHIEYRYEGY